MNFDQTPDDDQELGPLVRPYTVSRGRTRAGRTDLEVTTMVLAPHPFEHIPSADLDYEHIQVLRLCGRPLSIAEISSHLQLPLSVTKILVADLIERQLVVFRSTVTSDVTVLRAVIHGLQRL